MRYCHECGAEVAPEDSFCLSCGITLQPIQIVSAEPQDILADDGAVQKSEIALAEISASEQIAAAPPLDESAELPAISLELAPLDSTPENSPDGVWQAESLQDVAVSENLLDISVEDLAQSPSEQSEAATSSAAIAENASESIISVDEASVNEDLQPTLIGQNVNLLVSDFDATPIFPNRQTSEKPFVAMRDALAAEDKSSQPLLADFDKQQSESLPSAQNSVSELAFDKNEETPREDQPRQIAVAPLEAAPPVTPAVDLLPEAAAAPRPTEANRTQETPGSKSPKLKPLNIGTLLNNRYKVVRRIGGGGMGAVYLAEDQNLGGVLRAVKEMIQAYVDESQQEKAVADFRRESVLLTQLDHSSIPTIYDYFFDEANGRFYLVMKYIAGGDLAARLRAAPEGKLDEGSVTEWAIQIADVLDYLHNRQPPIVYRDLKPSNIMLDGGAGNKAMLIDFGIARWVNKEEKGVTAVGTMGYAPPELFAGNAEPRSDIYSLGATMFHLLTGADPQSNPLLIFDFTKNPRPRQINLMLSVEIEDILLRSVEYNSGLRFESAEKMRDDLREHLNKLKAGRLTFERSSHNLAQVMPIPAQAPPSVPFASQPAVNMVFCGFCGEKIIGTDMFCAYCGAPQGAAANAPVGLQQMQQTILSFDAAAVVGSSPASGGATARLIVLGTSELDAPLFRLEKENNLVGREDRRANIFPEVDLSKFDNKAQVSRRHARIWRDGASFMVEDLKSSNGTVLITDDNQTVRLQALQPHRLQHGDKLKLGDTTLRFYVN